MFNFITKHELVPINFRLLSFVSIIKNKFKYPKGTKHYRPCSDY